MTMVQTATTQTKLCNRCVNLGKPNAEHPIEDFYKDAAGKVLPTCKECRKEQVREYYQRGKKQESRRRKITGDLLAAKIVEDARPRDVTWRCMSCFAKRKTRDNSFPYDWKNLRMTVSGKEADVHLCAACARDVMRARRILDRATERLLSH